MNLKQLVIISLILFLSIVAWIAFDIYHVSVTTSVTALQMEQVAPLTPNFDSDIILKIKSRER